MLLCVYTRIFSLLWHIQLGQLLGHMITMFNLLRKCQTVVHSVLSEHGVSASPPPTPTGWLPFTEQP